jgi:molybdenum cofactor cytidylyltransferase
MCRDGGAYDPEGERHTEASDVGAVVAAAGLSSRMGDFKPMLSIGSEAFVRRVIKTFQKAGISHIALVTGFRGEELTRHVDGLGVICLRNEAYDRTEMFDSARIGLKYFSGRCSRLFFTPADVPLFSHHTVRRLLEAEGPLVVPVCGGRRGHPILLSASLIPPLLADGGEGGLRSALKRCAPRETPVEVPDEGMLRDADTPEEFQALLEYHARRTTDAEKD